jgi:hypothetical protein
MSYGRGSWFHSRSSSSEGERDKIATLVDASRSSRFRGVRWGGSKYDQNVIAFSNVISVNPSTMQTKIRQFIRLGYLKDDAFLPLKWSSLGEYWIDMSEGSQKLKGRSEDLERLIIAYGLALYAFDSRDYQVNPTRAYRPLLGLLQSVDASGFISTRDLHALIGDQNYSYWRLDFERAGILRRSNNGFKLTQKSSSIVNAVRTTKLPTNLTTNDWKKMHEDAFNSKNPYRDVIISEVEKILQDILPVENVLPSNEKNLVSSMVSSISTQEQNEIGTGDYTVKDTYSAMKTRKKQAAWSNLVREEYNYTCCVPGCDIQSSDLTTASHIKSYKAPESGSGHRADPRNGLCLCYLCHRLFDKGYFTLTDNLEIVVSSKVASLNSQIVNDILLKSVGKAINPQPSKFLPRKEYIEYHRKKIFEP